MSSHRYTEGAHVLQDAKRERHLQINIPVLQQTFLTWLPQGCILPARGAYDEAYSRHILCRSRWSGCDMESYLAKRNSWSQRQQTSAWINALPILLMVHSPACPIQRVPGQGLQAHLGWREIRLEISWLPRPKTRCMLGHSISRRNDDRKRCHRRVTSLKAILTRVHKWHRADTEIAREKRIQPTRLGLVWSR